MFYEEFDKLPEKKAKKILKSVNPILDAQAYDPETATIMTLNLPFYHGYQLLQISDHSAHPVRQNYMIYNSIDGAAHCVNFTNDLIYDLNKSIPLMLDEHNIFFYIYFFFNCVSGQHGRFLVVEKIDDIVWRDTPPPNAREVISRMIEPLTLLEAKKDGSYCVRGFMIFKTGLFKADITVDPKGHVTLSHEEMLIEDMPIIDDVIGY